MEILVLFRNLGLDQLALAIAKWCRQRIRTRETQLAYSRSLFDW